jgi:hypothetical protein
MAAVATSRVVGVTMTNESNRDHTTGRSTGRKRGACPKRDRGGTTVASSDSQNWAHNPISR